MATSRACSCAPSAIARYQKRISGPLLDRIDIHVEVMRVEYEMQFEDRTPSSAGARRIGDRDGRFQRRAHLPGITPTP
jgi:magnesium chelatase family protein